MYGSHIVRTRHAVSLIAGAALAAARETGPFTLQPGQAVMFLVAFGNVPVGSETTCPPAAQLVVTPPDEFDHVTLTVQGWPLSPCNSGELDATPVRPAGGGPR